MLEIHWPSGQVDKLKDIAANQLIFVKEGEGIVRAMRFLGPKNAKGLK